MRSLRFLIARLFLSATIRFGLARVLPLACLRFEPRFVMPILLVYLIGVGLLYNRVS